MKKILSIILAFSFVVPAYGAVVPAKKTHKDSKIAQFRKSIKDALGILKANWQCFTTGKGPKCSPARHLSLQIIRNFVTGKMKAVREGLRKFAQLHKKCWGVVLGILVAAGFVTAGALEDLYLGSVSLSAAEGSVVGVGGLVAVLVPTLADPDIRPKVWPKVKECLPVIGIDLPILLALIFILRRTVRKYEISKERINVKHLAGWTLLHAAAVKGDTDLIRELIDKGANVNAQNDDKRTPLRMAIMNGHVDAVKLLLDKGADLNTQDKDGNTPLHQAVMEHNLEIFKFLVEKGAKSDVQNMQGHTPLHLALISNLGQDFTWSLLDVPGINLDMKDGYNNTLLHRAIIQNNRYIAERLINEKKIDLDSQNKDGDTPLHLAVRNKQGYIINLLFDKGVSLTKKNKQGQEPYKLTTDAELQRKLQPPELPWQPQPLYEQREKYQPTRLERQD